MIGHNRSSDGVQWLTSVSVQDLCQLRSILNQDAVRGLFCLYGSWNKDLGQAEALLRQWSPSVRPGKTFVAGMVQVDESDESIQACCGENGHSLALGCCPPDELPALVAVVQDVAKTQSCIEIIRGVTPADIVRGSPPVVLNRVRATFNALILGVAMSRAPEDRRKRKSSSPAEEALRLFIAGDRSNVGKTSVCLGILGSLINMGYEPSDIAYIKPATQDESKQLLEVYCEKVGILCIPQGPVVYYKGFTRAFLAGETESTAILLDKVMASVQELGIDRRVVVIDGVGYPAVGSICGTDNVSVAKACGYSEQNPIGVIVVGPSGVGNAVDSYNLNASYFEAQGVPVMGAIFNKLALDGYYSLENWEHAMDHLDDFFQMFSEHVNVHRILERAREIQVQQPSFTGNGVSTKRMKGSSAVAAAARQSFDNSTRQSSREDIEARASAEGAVTSC